MKCSSYHRTLGKHFVENLHSVLCPMIIKVVLKLLFFNDICISKGAAMFTNTAKAEFQKLCILCAPQIWHITITLGLCSWGIRFLCKKIHLTYWLSFIEDIQWWSEWKIRGLPPGYTLGRMITLRRKSTWDRISKMYQWTNVIANTYFGGQTIPPLPP